MNEAGIEARRRRRWPRRVGIGALVASLLLVLAFAILWPMRFDIARNYIDNELARRGVRASYEVTRIGFGSQIFDRLVIGDPRRPDLIADHVEVQIVFGFTGPAVGLITARGVRMNGRIENGRLRLGEVDKLLPPPTGEPFRLPDQRVDVRDAALILATPAGEIVLAFAGQGNLSDGFRGGIALVARELRLGDCVLTDSVARLGLRIEDGRPRLHGPAAMARAACNGFAAERPLFALNAVLAPGLDHWRGSTATRIASMRADGQGLNAIRGHFSFDGDSARTAGSLDIATGAATAEAVHAAETKFEGRYAASARTGEISLDGKLGVLGVTFDGAESWAAALRGTRGSPIGPIGEALAVAIRNAGRGGADAVADLSLVRRGGGGIAHFRQLSFVARSGAQLLNRGGNGIAFHWPSGALAMDGDFTLSGGGFPNADFHLVQAAPGAPIEGVGRIGPMETGGARLALGPISFTAGLGRRTSFRTTALVDGPLNGGRVTGLFVPLSGRFGGGGFALGESCVAAGFRALQLQSLAIGPTRLSLCPVGRAMVENSRIGAELRAPRLAGRLGGTPITLAANRLRAGSDGFAATQVAVRLGAGDRVSRLDVASLSGNFAAGGLAGRFAGLSGQLASVPLLVGEGSGNWRLGSHALELDGRLLVADAQAPVRFHPLAGEDFELSLAGNHLHAAGTLIHPASRTRVVGIMIDHYLDRGAGNAILVLQPRLRFTPAFQPEALTPLTVGLVALVEGSVSGAGRISWDARGVSSTGAFETTDMNLAAPFGPVEGLSTRIRFTDLLGLTSAPAQEARIRVIRTGIDVYDGIVRYQLRPDYHVAVENARWPLAGGTLTLEPTMLDFSRESVKSLTFRVDGLDAARFIQTLEFSNIAATGTYDGTIPMLFDQNGGRVAGGHLVARPPGGTLSYIGELSDRDLGPYGVLAFDALKSLRYSRLEITLDGALAGEFLTRIDMDGLARDTGVPRRAAGGISGMVVGRVLNQLARIPFHFNIRVQGPFRALVATARSFDDPSDLIGASLPQLLRRQTQPEPAIQPHEREPVP